MIFHDVGLVIADDDGNDPADADADEKVYPADVDADADAEKADADEKAYAGDVDADEKACAGITVVGLAAAVSSKVSRRERGRWLRGGCCRKL